MDLANDENNVYALTVKQARDVDIQALTAIKEIYHKDLSIDICDL